MPAHPVTPAQFIRQHVLRMTTTEFAAALGVHKSKVSRYDSGGKIPARHHKRVLELARARKVRVPAGWFQAVPLSRAVEAAGVR